MGLSWDPLARPTSDPPSFRNLLLLGVQVVIHIAWVYQCPSLVNHKDLITAPGVSHGLYMIVESRHKGIGCHEADDARQKPSDWVIRSLQLSTLT